MQETQEMRVQSLDQEDPLEEDMATHSSILPEKSNGQGGPVGYSPEGSKELDTTEAAKHTHTWDLTCQFVFHEWYRKSFV